MLYSASMSWQRMLQRASHLHTLRTPATRDAALGAGVVARDSSRAFTVRFALQLPGVDAKVQPQIPLLFINYFQLATFYWPLCCNCGNLRFPSLLHRSNFNLAKTKMKGFEITEGNSRNKEQAFSRLSALLALSCPATNTNCSRIESVALSMC